MKPTYFQTMTAFNPFDAFIVPKNLIVDGPQPYRADSPYQRIVDSKIGFQRYLLKVENQNKLKDAEAETKKILCHITNWSFYRQEEGRFVPEFLDAKLCTHIIYSFGSLSPSSLTVKEFDKWADIDNDLYGRVTSLSRDVPVLLAIGGWTDSSGDKYSRLVSDVSARRRFILSVIPFLKQYGFKGLHFDWNYPKCWQSDCRKGPDSDRPNFTHFIQELSMALRRESLLLGVAISGYKEVILKAYDLAEISEAADFITVMSYDYHGAWEGRTGHISPLYGQSDDKYPQYNTDYTMKLLVKQGAQRNKLIVGVPFYGQSFTLRDTWDQLAGYGVPSRSPGKPGEITKQPGMLAYYEICDNIRTKRWQATRAKAGPYAAKGDQWIGYDDIESVALKAKYVIDSGFGGIAAWTVDLDDFNNLCCFEAFPLLHSINRAFHRISSARPTAGNCRRPPQPSTPTPPVTTTVGENGIAGGVVGEGTTWPGWKPGQTTTSSTTAWPSWTTPSTTTTPWWQTTTTTTTTSTTPRTTTWWPTTTTTTTRRTTTTPLPDDGDDDDSVVILPLPAPINVMPVMSGEKCQDGTYKADSSSCSSYWYCVYGEFLHQTCPNLLHWYNGANRCDWPANANCHIKQSDEDYLVTTTSKRPIYQKKTSTSSEAPSTTSTTTTERSTSSTTQRTTLRPSRMPRPSNGTCDEGVYYPNLNDCGSYYICNNRVLVPMECGPGLQWDQANEYCDLSSNVRCISSKAYLSFQLRANLQLDDPCTDSGYVPHPNDCNLYLICLFGNLQEQNCPAGLEWNDGSKNCDWPSDAHCESANSDELSEPDDMQDMTSSRPTKPTKPRPTTTTTTTKKPRPVTPRPDIKPLSGDFKLVCYFTNWAWYRQNRVAKYTPDNIDTRLCTHIIYGFAVLDYTELTIRTHDSWADIDNKFYQRVTDLKSKGVKVSLALGGWNDSQGDKYSRLVRSPASRAKFIKQALEFVEKYNFDGLDLDWEYPVCWQTECNKGFADEQDAFTAWVRELSAVFKPKGLLLSTAVSPSQQIIDKGYDVAEISKYFDWISVMTYDYHGQWDKKTGHVAPLYYHPDDAVANFNAVSRFALHTFWRFIANSACG